MTTAKQPQDRKPKAEKAPARPEQHDMSEKFVYESSAGEFELPYIENLTRGTLRKIKAADRDTVDDLLFSLILSEEDLERLDEITLWEYRDLAEKWNEESAVNLGEL